MAAGTAPIFGQKPKTQGTNFTNATGTTKTTVFTAGVEGARLLSLQAVTSDTSPNDVNIYVQVAGSGTVYNLGGKRVPLASGDVVANTIAGIQLLDVGQFPGLQPDGSLLLGPGDVVQAGVVAAVTAAKTLTIFAQGLDY